MATLPGNPYGAVAVLDGENPRTFTAYAVEAISGGQFVYVSGATGAVGSSTSSFLSSDIQVGVTADATKFNGIALANVASGGIVAVASRGSFILKCGGSVFGGTIVETIGDSIAVQTLTSGAVPSALYAGVPGAKNAGRALTDGASGGFAIISINA
jgi:hypothetical protein